MDMLILLIREFSALFAYQSMVIVSFLINFFFIFISTPVPPPSPSLDPHPSHPTTHPLFRGSKASLGESTKSGIASWSRTPPSPVWRPSKVFHHSKWVPKRVHIPRISPDPTAPVPQTNQATKLSSPTPREPSSVPCRLPSWQSRLRDSEGDF